MKRICLIEFNGYHEECLYSQLRFLKESGYWVSLIIHAKLKKRVEPYRHLADDLKIVNTGSKVFFLKRIFRVFQIKNHLKKTGVGIVMFNTASSNKETILLSFLLKNIKLVGIIHNLNKLNGSTSQKLISKNIRHYFVLNDALLKNSSTSSNKLRFESFYPIYFQSDNLPTLAKNSDNIWVTIPGKIELKRRDYEMIISVMKEISSEHRPQLILLGNLSSTDSDHQKIRRQITKTHLAANIKTFDVFIDNDLFHAYLAASDYILLPSSNSGEYYADAKIMGAYNLAFSHKKPLIFPDSLKVVDDLVENGISYSHKDQLAQILNKKFLKTSSVNTTYQNRKWDFETQQKKYLDFIEA